MWAYLGIVFATVIAVIAALLVLWYGSSGEADWVRHGTPDGPVMRRRVNGEWQTREMSEGEMRAFLESLNIPSQR